MQSKISDIIINIAQDEDINLLYEFLKHAQGACESLSIKVIISNYIQGFILIDISKHRAKRIFFELCMHKNAQAYVIVCIAGDMIEQVDCIVQAEAHSKLSMSSILSVNHALTMNYRLYNIGAKASIMHAGAYTIGQGGNLTLCHEQHHTVENTHSTTAFYGNIEGNGVVTFDGMIAIEAEAIWAVATLSHKSLISSEQAYVRSVPNLEIKTNEVSCKHATAVECIDEDQLFYLMARGLSKECAQEMISYGFCIQAFDIFDSNLKRTCLQYIDQQKKIVLNH